MTGPDTIARDIANRVAGTTRDHLLERVHAAHRAIEAWDTAFSSALAHPNGMFAPPLTVKEAATALNSSETTIRELVLQGKLGKVSGLGSSVRIPHAEIARMLMQTNQDRREERP